MINHRSPAHLSIASSAEIEQTARQLKATREQFLTTRVLPRHPVRPMILASWQRCQTLQVNPSLRYAPLAITHEAELTQLREANQLLMRAAGPAMSYLSDFLADSGYVIVLSDAGSCLLEVIGPAGTRRRLARIDFAPGGDWSEAAAGTNALGTAIADGHVVQLLGAEHYCAGWQDLTCTAAPLRHPVSGEIMGVLDVTGDYRLIRPFLSGLLAAMALHVQQEMRSLLTSTRKGHFQAKGDLVPLSFPSETHSPEYSMHTALQHRALDAHRSATGDGMRSLSHLRERRAYDATLLAAAISAISASLDVDVTLEKVAEQTAHLLRLETASVCLFGEGNEIGFLHTCTREQGAEAKFRQGLYALLERSEVISLIRERGEPLVLDDVLTSMLLPATLVEQLGMRSLLLLPLITARGVIGCILAHKCSCSHWRVDDVLLGLTLAVHAATAIENARLFTALERHAHRMEMTSALTQFLSTLSDPREHLEVILRYIVEIVDMDAGMILLRAQHDQQADGLRLAAHYGLPEGRPPDLGDLAGLVMTTGKSSLTCTIERENHNMDEAPQTGGFCDVMAVLLVTSRTIPGVLLVGSLSHRQLSTEDLALLATIGQQLGLTFMNAQLRRSASEMEVLREADRLKSQFIAAVSHDLQSPLTAIRASVEGLLDQAEVQSTQMHECLLQNIAGEASRLGRLVDQLLDLSRIEAGVLSLDREWTELPVLIADTATKFEELHRGWCVEQDLAADVPVQYVDPDRLAQVVWNLLENAQKYAPSCTSIKVEARWTGKGVLIGVADRGPGIPAEEREKIFQHFYRLKRDQGTHTQGSGLGLAICQGIVQAHGGRIWVEDQPGGGSVFRFALPPPTASLSRHAPPEKTERGSVSTEESL